MKASADMLAELPTLQREAIEDYTGTVAKELNTALRRGVAVSRLPTSVRGHVEHLDAAIKKHATTHRRLYSGLRFHGRAGEESSRESFLENIRSTIERGETLEWRSYQSFAIDSHVAGERFGGASPSGVVLEVVGARGLDISGVSVFNEPTTSETEVITPRGLKLRPLRVVEVPYHYKGRTTTALVVQMEVMEK